MGLTTHPRPHLKSPPLKRGTACLACRKRKSRCDGAHPVCTQCVKAHREDQCHYGDSKRKSRTQQLREKVTTLRDRVHELEYETNGFQNVSLYPMYQTMEDDTLSLSSFTDVILPSSSSSSSLSASPSSSTIEMTPYLDVSPLRSSDYWDQDTLDFVGYADEFSPLSGPPSLFNHLCQWNPKNPFSDGNKQLLVDIFISHRNQCWFDVGQERPLSESTRHPALMNAVYLLGSSHVKDAVYFSRLETVYLHRALQEINSSLGDCDHLPDVARASSLIALYFFSTGRIVDGYRHSFSAARLAVGLGLHQIHAPDLHGFLSNSSPTSCPDNVLTNKPPVPLSPPTDCFETHDRVSAFWQVFMVDHCWSAANSLPTLLPDTSDAQARIETPWPMLFPNATSDAKQDGTSPRLTVSVPAMKVKAALLYERASALYPGPQSPQDPKYWHEVASVGNAVKALQNYMPAVRTYAPSGEAFSVDLDALFVNTLLSVCAINVQTHSDPAGALYNAQQAVSFIRHLNDVDYEYLDPLFATWWNFVGNTYIAAIRNSPLVDDSYNKAADDLQLLARALSSLGRYVPMAVTHGQQIDGQLSIFRDAQLPSPFFSSQEALEYPIYA